MADKATMRMFEDRDPGSGRRGEERQRKLGQMGCRSCQVSQAGKGRTAAGCQTR